MMTNNIYVLQAKRVLLLACLFCNNSYFSQQKIDFIFENNFETSINVDLEIKLIKNNSDKILYCNETVEDTLFIWGKNNKLNYIIEDENVENIYVKNVEMFNDLLIITIYRKTLIYKKEDNIYYYEETINHRYSTVVFLDSINLFCYNNYNYHPNDCPPNERTRFAIYNILTREYSVEKNMNFNFHFYTHLISKFVDVSPDGKKIILAQTIPYEIKIYDINLNLIDSIKRGVKCSKIDRLDKLETIGDSLMINYNSVKETIRELSKLDKKINRIAKTYFLDDSTILVVRKMSKSNKNKEERNLDVWRYRNDSWKLIIDNQKYSSSWLERGRKEIKLFIPFAQSEGLVINNGKIYVQGTYFPYHNFKSFKELIKFVKTMKRDKMNYGIHEFKYEIK